MIKLYALLFLVIFTAIGCSSNDHAGTTPGNAVGIDVGSLDDTTGETTDGSVNGDGSGAGSTNPVAVDINSIAPDPLVPNTTQVNFDITVPAFQSDALQVRLVWGEKILTAMWVGDEFWTASDDFQTDTENRLTVTFYDDNGGVVLASFEAAYRTGVNASEAYQVTADQFDSRQWDDDGDGISNMNELVAGTTPINDETYLLEIREPSIWQYFFIQNISGKYESEIPVQRPYFENTEETPEVYVRPYSVAIKTIDIDETGTGSFVDNVDFYHGDVYGSSDVGTRTNTGSSITWMGTFGNYEYDAGHTQEEIFYTETRFMDELTRQQVGAVEGSSCCASERGNWNHSYTLTGTVLDDSPDCLAIAGTVDQKFTDALDSTYSTATTKDSADRYWKVVETRDGVVQEEYLLTSLGRNFYCDFGDLQ